VLWVFLGLLACANAFIVWCCLVVGGDADRRDKRLFEEYMKNKGGEDDGNSS